MLRFKQSFTYGTLVIENVSIAFFNVYRAMYRADITRRGFNISLQTHTAEFSYRSEMFTLDVARIRWNSAIRNPLVTTKKKSELGILSS